MPSRGLSTLLILLHLLVHTAADLAPDVRGRRLQYDRSRAHCKHGEEGVLVALQPPLSAASSSSGRTSSRAASHAHSAAFASRLVASSGGRRLKSGKPAVTILAVLDEAVAVQSWS